MKPVDPRNLIIGTVSLEEFFSDKGELLIARGVTITQSLMETLNRRNIFELYVRQSDEEELHDLVSREFAAPVAFDDEGRVAPIFPANLDEIKYGKNGLQQLIQSPLAFNLDKSLRNHQTFDTPVGSPLSLRAKQISVKERTDEYKNDIMESYNAARDEVSRVLASIASGERTDGRSLRGVVERFVRIFLKDRNILINISTIKPASNEYLFNHSLNVCLLSINIAAASGYSENQVVEIGLGALLHDVGMLLIPKGIMLKSGRLDLEEWFEIQKHPIIGLHLLEKIRNLPDSIPYIAYQVHERENGKGYPKMRKSLLIHRFAKVVQIADIYEAMSSPRVYREAYAPYNSVERLIKMVQQGFLDGDCMKAFLKYASLFPIGSIVMLNDSRLARVVDSNPASITRPVVSILTDERGEWLNKEKICQENLADNKNVQIVKTLPFGNMKRFDVIDGF